MIRLAVSVEGATEREFVHTTLAPHLQQFAVFATPIELGRPPNLDRISNELRRLLGSFQRVTTLYDYYGFQRRKGLTPNELAKAIVERAPEGTRARVIGYVQQYELEALMFADPAKTAEVLSAPEIATQLADVVAQCGSPERIDDGYESCPSRRLERVYPAWDKVLHGPRVTQAIGIAGIAEKCPRFADWIAQLELLPDAAT